MLPDYTKPLEEAISKLEPLPDLKGLLEGLDFTRELKALLEGLEKPRGAYTGAIEGVTDIHAPDPPYYPNKGQGESV